ncbi:MAG TPA: PQQ-dependent sugar dehydrogenase [Kofleriaceae bacterium]|nr:PQQ-dependent sugar dehydrogenase [Kofleriaceae bacterium]
MIRRFAWALLVVGACHGETHRGNEPRADVVVVSKQDAPPGVPDARPAAPPREPIAPVPVPADAAAHVAMKKIMGGLHRPVLLAVAPGDRERLFVVEQRGDIVILRGGKLAKRPFFTIDGLSDGNEQGLLGLAFHPRFAENGKLYVDYTTEDKATHIVEYQVDARDRDRVDPKTARELLVIEHPYSNHNGGNVVFGPDGKLWLGMGDGGSAGDPHDNGQNPRVLLGKLIRLDVDAPAPKPEVVAIGMRNPWRFAFDEDGDLYIGDVGQDKWESVYAIAHDDLVGHNFGWSVREGRHCFKETPCDRADFVMPIADYAHGAEGCSVTGGFVYRGAAIPSLRGVYFYGDFCTGKLWSLRWSAADGARDHWAWKDALDPDGDLVNLSSFGTDAAGEMYLLSLDGNLFELVPR